MDAATERPAHPSRTHGRSNHHSSNQAAQQTYGYHNTFHTHTPLIPGTPPSYACANNPRTLQFLEEKARTEVKAVRESTAPPPYTCTVEIGAVLGLKQELSSPFQVANHRQWSDAYALLQGTQLSIYRVKQPSIFNKKRGPGPGRHIRSFTLQHAEVGIAADFKKTSLIPRSPFAHLVPAVSRAKLYETDPHLFETVREHVIRVRLETEQFLLCAKSQEEMLDWIENLCAAIDISSPLEDRSEPRYRSLPRRSRRQRILDGSRLGEDMENVPSVETGRRIVAEQERIIRQLYPHLAGSTSQGNQDSTNPGHGSDPEIEDFDPEDVRFPARRPGSLSFESAGSRDGDSNSEGRSLSSATTLTDPKLAPRLLPSQSQVIRYRRRCAPVLLSSSPRVSDVVFSDGTRMRINVKERCLVDYCSQPPRYDAHHFSRAKRLSKLQPSPRASQVASTKAVPPPVILGRPLSPSRENSDESLAFELDPSSTSSEQHTEEIRSAPSSEPPSPTALSHAKVDAARQLVHLGKHRHSEESRENGLNPAAFGIGLLI